MGILGKLHRTFVNRNFRDWEHGKPEILYEPEEILPQVQSQTGGPDSRGSSLGGPRSRGDSSASEGNHSPVNEHEARPPPFHEAVAAAVVRDSTQPSTPQDSTQATRPELRRPGPMPLVTPAAASLQSSLLQVPSGTTTSGASSAGSSRSPSQSRSTSGLPRGTPIEEARANRRPFTVTRPVPGAFNWVS